MSDNNPTHPTHLACGKRYRGFYRRQKKRGRSPLVSQHFAASTAQSLAAAHMKKESDLILGLLSAGGASKDVDLAVLGKLLNCSCVELDT